MEKSQISGTFLMQMKTVVKYISSFKVLRIGKDPIATINKHVNVVIIFCCRTINQYIFSQGNPETFKCTYFLWQN